MRFCTTTLGCKANQYDTGTIEGALRARGHEHVGLGEGCDICIINTCAVTAESVRKSRQAIRRVKRLEPFALIAVCGCYSELEGDAAALMGADMVSGTSDREEFALKVEELVRTTHSRERGNPLTTYQTDHLPLGAASHAPTHSPLPTPQSILNAPHSPRTRALLKIQDGCDNHCAYCVIPLARGRSRSMPLDEIRSEARWLEMLGYKEIVLTGIEISSYANDSQLSYALSAPHPALHTDQNADLLVAVRAVSEAAPSNRLRIGSLDPKILADEFIQNLSEIPNICNHFHISLQSGCDEVLGKMGRGYSRGQVLKSIQKLRSVYDNCGITADVIIGFPGESDAQFEETMAFIEEAAFSGMHIFPFSPRPKTKAAKMRNKLARSVIKERVKITAETADRLSKEFRDKQIGKILEVLFERQKGIYTIGHSSNYLNVAADKNAAYDNIGKNSLKEVRITHIDDDLIFGEII